MRLEIGMNPRDETRRRRSGSGYFWIALCAPDRLGCSRLPACALSSGSSIFGIIPRLDNVDRITHTADGHPGDPLNIAMVATEEELIRAMVAIGWYPANSITFESSLRIVVDSVLRRPDDEAPVSSLYLFGRKQDLAFEQPVGNSPRQRHHVRFWRSAEKEDDRPLWFGAATFDRSVGLSHTTGEVTHHIGPDVDAERDRIANNSTEGIGFRRSIGRIIFTKSSKAATAAAIHGIPMGSSWSSCSKIATPTPHRATKPDRDKMCLPSSPSRKWPRPKQPRKLTSGDQQMRAQAAVVFLVDVDNTLLNNDRIQEDLKRHIERKFGREYRDRFWAIQERLFEELGYRDYLGALQRFRVENPYEPHLVTAATFLVDYPFANRLYPEALDVLEQLRQWGQTVILSDGDVVFQPRKVERSGIFEAVDGHVLIYIHKEESLEDVVRRYPAEHYVMVDDKLRILTAIKKYWGDRVTTVFPRQGQFAYDPQVLASYPPADITVDRIGSLLEMDLANLLESRQPTQPTGAV